jgi:hypothetical protein
MNQQFRFVRRGEPVTKIYRGICVLVMFGGLVMLGVRLRADVQPATDSLAPITTREISAEEARQALIEMIERTSEGAIKWTLPHVKSAKITPSAVGGKWSDIGPSACYLKERMFSLHGGGASYFLCRGVLELSEDGKWQARITQSGHVCALPVPPPPPPPAPPPVR